MIIIIIIRPPTAEKSYRSLTVYLCSIWYLPISQYLQTKIFNLISAPAPSRYRYPYNITITTTLHQMHHHKPISISYEIKLCISMVINTREANKKLTIHFIFFSSCTRSTPITCTKHKEKKKYFFFFSEKKLFFPIHFPF